MESVEEMCDYIALIHQSHKIIDGKLADIKRQFRSNTYQIGLKTARGAEVEKLLQEKFVVSQSDVKMLDSGVTLDVRIPKEATPNDLLSLVTEYGQVQHFLEMVPSANDIFMQAVTKNS